MAAIVEDLSIKLRIAYHICLVVGTLPCRFLLAPSCGLIKELVLRGRWTYKKDLIVLTPGGVAI